MTLKRKAVGALDDAPPPKKAEAVAPASTEASAEREAKKLAPASTEAPAEATGAPAEATEVTEISDEPSEKKFKVERDNTDLKSRLVVGSHWVIWNPDRSRPSQDVEMSESAEVSEAIEFVWCHVFTVCVRRL